MATPDDDDDWELFNDNGFIYKRKRRRLDSTATTSVAPPPPPDPSVEERNSLLRKKRALVKIKEKYRREILLWEHLSNISKDMERNSQTLQQKQLEHQRTTSSPSVGPISSNEPPAESTSDSTCRGIIDELLTQVELQEAIIRDVSNLCDVAEALCNTEEERFKKQFTDLPIWEPSPPELMAALDDK